MPSKKRKTCTKGYSCGAACISLNKACRKGFPDGVSVSLETRSLELSYPLPAPRTKISNFKASRKIQDPLLEKTREDLVSMVGEELVKLAEKNVAKVLAEADMEIRVPNGNVLISILKDRFKSQFETKKSRGWYMPDIRKKVERDVLGLSENIKDEDRPIYGAFNTKGRSSGAEGYGAIKIVLKDEVRSRTTLTGGDSLNSWEDNGDTRINAGRTPPPNSDFQIGSLFKVDRDGIVDGTGDIEGKLEDAAVLRSVGALAYLFEANYVEFQVHDKLLPKDIAQIELPKWVVSPREQKEIREWAGKNNVELSVI